MSEDRSRRVIQTHGPGLDTDTVVWGRLQQMEPGRSSWCGLAGFNLVGPSCAPVTSMDARCVTSVMRGVT